jgi:ferredoxin
MKILVSEEMCIGCGDCEYSVPQVFEMGDDNIVMVRVVEVPEELQEQVQLAVETCPYEALSIA